MADFLKRTPVLWALFVLQILIGLGFMVFREAAGGQLIDMVRSGEGARAVIAGMTDAQRTAHFWTTVLWDSAYPLAYGGFFMGMALRFFGRFGWIAALPGLATIIVDFTENTVQALALSGTADYLDVKDWLTPLKYNLALVASVIALVAVVIAIVNLIRKKRA
ncbi:MAG: hypothetical protein KDA53_11595 [Hyphomonas sp.]|nr:hypothetical protein [Hyphomonas sp.]